MDVDSPGNTESQELGFPTLSSWQGWVDQRPCGIHDHSSYVSRVCLYNTDRFKFGFGFTRWSSPSEIPTVEWPNNHIVYLVSLSLTPVLYLQDIILPFGFLWHQSPFLGQQTCIFTLFSPCPLLQCLKGAVTWKA